MHSNLIFAPVLVQVALTLWLYISLGKAKVKAFELGEVDEDRRALHDDAWPDSVMQINNNIRNQFEVPVLFYVLIGIIWAIGAVNIVVHIAAWAFAITRIAHMTVHTGSNHVPLRRKVFTWGCIILIGLLVFAAGKLAVG